jgi:flavin-dependent dehydrogenase
LPWRSFDLFLLEEAQRLGVRLRPGRVVRLDWDETGRPQVHGAKGAPTSYDLLVGAVGVNGSGARLFDALQFGYQPPPTVKAFIGEFYLGKATVEPLLGRAMHIFLLDIPGLEFMAITPKGHYATMILLGEPITPALIDTVIRHPAVQGCLPSGWTHPVMPCQCQPRVNVGDPLHYYADRVVMVGDASVSRLYKDGIGAAYRTAKACATTVLTQGISAAAFERHYRPACRRLSWDNRLGHAVFAGVGLLRSSPRLQNSMVATIRQELATGQRGLSGALWGAFTGSEAYRNILLGCLHPMVWGRLGLNVFRSLPRSDPGP